MRNHINTFVKPKPLGADLIVAIISLVLIFLARPLLAQTFGAETTAMATSSSTQAPTSDSNSSAAPQTSSPQTTTGGTASGRPMDSTMSPGTYVNPIIRPAGDRGLTTGSSQSQRAANSQHNNAENNQIQPLPECKVDDTICIEQRNQQNRSNPQTAPAFIR